MKSLDDILGAQAEAQYQDQLQRVLDFSLWTPSNRDEKLEEIRALSDGVCDLSINFVEQLMETKIDGKSLIWYNLKKGFIQGEIEYLLELRNSLDTQQDLEGIVSYDWLTSKIKERYAELLQVEELLQRTVKLPDDSSVSEL